VPIALLLELLQLLQSPQTLCAKAHSSSTRACQRSLKPPQHQHITCRGSLQYQISLGSLLQAQQALSTLNRLIQKVRLQQQPLQ
jgi:hypothetical protein